jgi:8-oxo-dGTP pyrophosphatase MutT (NUDIX family)
MRIAKSYGIICIKKHLNETKFLMIKKAITYHFAEFVNGHYKKKNESHLSKLFNGMTYNEKMDILSFNFDNLWYRIYRQFPDKIQNNKLISFYHNKKNKFENTFLHDQKLLRKIISNTTNTDTLWEFPKGRSNNDEKNINTAIREFTEETGINEDKIKIIWSMTPYVETYKDFGMTYQNIYYYAEAIDEWEPKINFLNNCQISEVSNVAWISKSDILSLKQPRLINFINKIFKKYKNQKKM